MIRTRPRTMPWAFAVVACLLGTALSRARSAPAPELPPVGTPSIFLGAEFTNVDITTMPMPGIKPMLGFVYSPGAGWFNRTWKAHCIAVAQATGGSMMLDYEENPAAAASIVGAEAATIPVDIPVYWFAPANITGEINLGVLKRDFPDNYDDTVAHMREVAMPTGVHLCISGYARDSLDFDHWKLDILARIEVWKSLTDRLVVYVSFRREDASNHGSVAPPAPFVPLPEFVQMIRTVLDAGVGVVLWHDGEALTAENQPYWDAYLAEAKLRGGATSGLAPATPGFLSPPGGGGGGSGGSGGGGGGGGGGSSFTGGGDSLGSSSGTGVTTVRGGGGGAGGSVAHAVASFANPAGARVSMPVFSREEIEAAILRAKGTAFDGMGDKVHIAGAGEPPASPADSK